VDEEGFEVGLALAGLEGEEVCVFKRGEEVEDVGVYGGGAGEALLEAGGGFEVESGGGGFHLGFDFVAEGVAREVGGEGVGSGDLVAVLGEGNGAVAGGGAFAHFFVDAGFGVGGEDEEVVIAAEVEEVFEEFDEAGGGVFVADGADILKCRRGGIGEGGGFAEAREGALFFDGDPPARVFGPGD